MVASVNELPFGLRLTATVFAAVFLVALEPLRWPPPGVPVFGPEFPVSAIVPVRLIAFGAIAAILIGYRVRTACLLLGAAGFLTTAWNQVAYENNIAYSALALVMIGLYEPGRVNLLRGLVVLCYFGAAVDKVLSPGWRSGVFFDIWAGSVIAEPAYQTLAAKLPPLLLAQVVSWATIVIEFAFMAAFLWPRITPYAIPFIVLFHVALTTFANNPYGLYTISMSVTTLAFVRWERFCGVVLYDDDCGICVRTRRLFERLSNRWTWMPNTLAARYGLTTAQTDDALYVVTGSETVPSFRAFRRIVLSLPLTYVLLACLYALAYRPFHYRVGQLAAAAFVGLVLVLLTPTAIGDAAYYAFAKRRYLISRACGLERTPQTRY